MPAVLTPSNIDPNLVVSKALTLTQGTVASGANRYDADTIAKYLFSEGAAAPRSHTTPAASSPAADLTLTGHDQCDGSWGLNFRPAAARHRQPFRRAPSCIR